MSAFKFGQRVRYTITGECGIYLGPHKHLSKKVDVAFGENSLDPANCVDPKFLEPVPDLYISIALGWPRPQITISPFPKTHPCRVSTSIVFVVDGWQRGSDVRDDGFLQVLQKVIQYPDHITVQIED